MRINWRLNYKLPIYLSIIIVVRRVVESSNIVGSVAVIVVIHINFNLIIK